MPPTSMTVTKSAGVPSMIVDGDRLQDLRRACGIVVGDRLDHRGADGRVVR
ncbi:hypothetical protein [Microbacterium aurantiacum]|uniref:hypothetical protein n=1 Tax=Microbacterium aurantiacum TaxID=162393 RepID=UPI0018D024D2|nr:hypothetical protein [Microbacterium chocolatum]